MQSLFIISNQSVISPACEKIINQCKSQESSDGLNIVGAHGGF